MSSPTCMCPNSVAASLAPAITFLVPSSLMSVGSFSILLLLFLSRILSALRPKSLATNLDNALNDVVNKFYDIEISESSEQITAIRATLSA
ncbi:hypothetical protein H0H87_005165 [Tephrocybe sp. NHM501043]|nr:hypothetical protein H0H87_005165 [Tephrocybe sp. NHM501043]